MSRSWLAGTLAALSCLAAMATSGAWAGTVLDRVRQAGTLRCVADAHPGLAMRSPSGRIEGRAVDLCRAIAIAVLGARAPVVFTVDASPGPFDVAFLEAANAERARADRTRLDHGPAVFVERLSMLVPAASRVRTVADLSGETICLMIGSPEQSALESVVRRRGIDVTRLAFEEDVEMRDAYAVGRCGAIIGDARDLSGLIGPMGINRLTSRLLPEPLALVSVVVATANSDRAWSAIVFWVTHTLVGDLPDAAPWDGLDTPPDGLRPGWRREAAMDFRAADAPRSTEP